MIGTVVSAVLVVITLLNVMFWDMPAWFDFGLFAVVVLNLAVAIALSVRSRQ